MTASESQSQVGSADGHVVGVDTGGTFTDIVVVGQDGEIYFDKAFSTPPDPSGGVFDALEHVSKTLVGDVRDLVGRTRRFAHGTTVGTNAVIQRRGARVGLIMTKGFEDTLLIGRGPMGKNLGLPHSQALDFLRNERPAPLAAGSLTQGVSERVAVDGSVIAPLDEEECLQALNDLVEKGVESLAVCFLWSFRNGAHERRVRDLARQVAPGIPVSLSCEVSPVLGEFPRVVTTAVNAYVGPVLVRYVERLTCGLAERGYKSPVQLMLCSGGSTLPATIENQAVGLVNSGVIGGLVAAKQLGRVLGYQNIITTDMGGTSFDVGVIHAGEYEMDPLPVASPGLPLQVPAVKVVTIGAGGGSIASTDGRRLLVGPQSAGADPGPACYGRGGAEATVTDALLVLGLLDGDNFFGGRQRLDRRAAEAAIQSRVASPLGMSLEEAAAGIYEIVTAKMADLIRKTTVESGSDPREFVLFAYGGAAPAHAALYADSLGVGEVIVPYSSSVFSALGCALSDITYTYAHSQPTTLIVEEGVLSTMSSAFDELERRARLDMSASGYESQDIELLRKLDLRYEGQMSELTIDFRSGPLGPEIVREIREQFEKTYETRFGRGTSRAQSPIEIITFRLDALMRTPKPDFRREPEGSPDPSALCRGARSVYLRATGSVLANVYDGGLLRSGHVIPGPAIIERPDTTVFIPSAHSARVDPYRNLHIERRPGA